MIGRALSTRRVIWLTLGSALLGGALAGSALWVTTPAEIQLPRPMGQVPGSGGAGGTGPGAAGKGWTSLVSQSAPAASPPSFGMAGLGAAAGPAAPVHLAIPALKVVALVVPVRAAAGLLGVPRSINEVGWWAGGGVPGARTGTVVIDGHVDSASGLGALWPLRFAQVGDQIMLTLADGVSVGYRIRGVRVYLKAELPALLFAGAKGVAVLALITCGGPFDRTTGHYADNVVVYAVPA